MKVTLLNFAQDRYFDSLHELDNEYLVKIGAAICVDKLDAPTKKGMMTALDSGHLSILEHLPLTFLVEDVSRALTHQLVRHRIASYSQMSQRYAKVDTDEEWYVVPDSITGNIFVNEHSTASIEEKYYGLMADIARVYNEMIEAGIPNEDARMVLPNACFTSIIVTMNARAFVEAGQKRICNKAQWEIRTLFREMRNLIKDIYPTVYDMTKPNCQKGGCTEKKRCDTPYKD